LPAAGLLLVVTYAGLLLLLGPVVAATTTSRAGAAVAAAARSVDATVAWAKEKGMGSTRIGGACYSHSRTSQSHSSCPCRSPPPLLSFRGEHGERLDRVLADATLRTTPEQFDKQVVGAPLKPLSRTSFKDVPLKPLIFTINPCKSTHGAKRPPRTTTETPH
jgi:hypothetical protein